MDKEIKEYLDRLPLGLSSKEDMEKLRQEMKSGLRQLKEENRNQILEWRQEVKKDFEELGKGLLSTFQQMSGEVKSALGQSSEEVNSSLRSIREQEIAALTQLSQENRLGVDQAKEGMEGLRGEINRVVEGISAFHKKIEGSITEVREELGSMMRFSFADLEKKLNALEARIKALEKMVFP